MMNLLHLTATSHFGVDEDLSGLLNRLGSETRSLRIPANVYVTPEEIVSVEEDVEGRKHDFLFFAFGPKVTRRVAVPRTKYDFHFGFEMPIPLDQAWQYLDTLEKNLNVHFYDKHGDFDLPLYGQNWDIDEGYHYMPKDVERHSGQINSATIRFHGLVEERAALEALGKMDVLRPGKNTPYGLTILTRKWNGTLDTAAISEFFAAASNVAMPECPNPELTLDLIIFRQSPPQERQVPCFLLSWKSYAFLA